jgi:D-alanyl-D-alanine carboxypeptidase
MSPQLYKELRSISTFFFAALLVPLVVVVSRSRAPHLLAQDSEVAIWSYITFTALLASSPIGSEMTHGAMLMLLSQPVRRSRVWNFKMLLLGGALAIVALALVLVWPTVGLKDRYLFVLTALFAFGVTPWLGILAGDSLTAAVLTVAVEVFIAITIWSLHLPRRTEVLIVTIIFSACAAAGYFAGYRAFRDWEAAPAPRFGIGALLRLVDATSPDSRRGAFMSLLVKELNLHRINLALAASFCVFILPARDDRGFFLFYYCVTSVCAGAIAVARERQLGVLDWHLALPISRARQWVLKVSVCLSIVLVTSALLPLALTRARITGQAWRNIDFNTSLVLLGVTLALLVSALVRGALRAAVIGFGALLFAITILNEWLAGTIAKLGLYDLVSQANPLWVNRYTLGVLALIGAGLILGKAFQYFSYGGAVRSYPRLIVGVAALGVILIGLLDIRLHASSSFGLWTEKEPLKAILVEEASRHPVPGLAAVVTSADTTLEVGVSGSLTLNDRLGLPSCHMTATMLAALVEQGKLAWNTRFLDVFPEWINQVRPEYRLITLTDLLSHHAGLPQYKSSNSPEWQDVRSLSGTPTKQRRELALHALRRQPAAPPQTDWLDSNAGCPIAAAMAERVTGESWESLMQSLLFQPLGIHATLDWPAYLLPDVGIAMTIGDYAKFLQLHLKGLKGQDGILKSETIRHLHAPVHSHSFFDRMDSRWALGWGLIKFEGARESFIAGGWTDSGDSSRNFFFLTSLLPSRDLAAAVFANSTAHNGDACKKGLARVLHRYPPNPKGGW